VLTPSEIRQKLDLILPNGTEARALHRRGAEPGSQGTGLEIKTKVALVFPDIYDLGMSNLGLAILYDSAEQAN
jgi:hypothetical protein